MPKQKAIFFGIVIAILVILNILALFKVQRLRNENNQFLEAVLNGDTRGQAGNLYMLKRDQLLAVGSSNEKLPGDVSLSDELGNKMTIDDLCRKGKKFIFRYSHLNCNVCVDVLIPELKALSENIGEDNLVFIASYLNDRDLHVFKRVNEIRTPIYNTESLPIPLEEENLPYCFVLNEDHSVTHLFIPRKEMLDQTEEYFTMIRDLFSH